MNSSKHQNSSRAPKAHQAGRMDTAMEERRKAPVTQKAPRALFPWTHTQESSQVTGGRRKEKNRVTPWREAPG